MHQPELRNLNFDDLYLLKYLSLGYSLTKAAMELHLSQPALSQRIKKMEGVFDLKLIRRNGRKISLTKEGELLCRKANEALAVMSAGQLQQQKIKNINLGTRPEVGFSWLWPTVEKLAVEADHIRYHISFGSGEELLANLGAGRLDAVLTSTPVMAKEYGSIELAEEKYVFVAAKQIAGTVRKLEDLKQHLLIEHDRSFAFQRYLPSDIRQKVQFSDVWFIESSELMRRAIAKGFGVGIVPEYLCSSQKSSLNQVEVLNLNIRLSSDCFRIIYRKDRGIDDEIHLLADQLKVQGLG